MAYLACDKDGQEIIFVFQPKRENEKWKAQLFHVFNTPVMEETAYVKLPSGSIAKLIGRELTWKDEPVELK